MVLAAERMGAINPSLERTSGNWKRSFWTRGGAARKEARSMAEGRLRRRRGVDNNGLPVVGGNYLTSVDVDKEVQILQKISPKKRN